MLAVGFGAPLGAHERVALSCDAPQRPPSKQDAARWNAFVDAVDVYRACIHRFVAQNHNAAEHHRSAANAATTAWNDFVRDHLNVPEDFPHPDYGPERN